MSGKASGRTLLAEHPGGPWPDDGGTRGASFRAAQTWAAASKVKNEDRWFVCLRGGAWYALGPRMAVEARGNPDWPGDRRIK